MGEEATAEGRTGGEEARGGGAENVKYFKDVARNTENPNYCKKKKIFYHRLVS